MEKKWCMCVELQGVARDGYSTCIICGGKDAYGKSEDRPIDKKKVLLTGRIGETLPELIGETRSIKKICPVHGEYDSHVVVVNGASLFSSCEKCAEEKEAAEKALTLSGNKKLEEKWKAMGIKPIFYDKTLDNFELVRYVLKERINSNGEKESYFKKVPAPELGKMVPTMRRLVAGEIKKVVMLGGHGLGKNHLAVGALKEFGDGKIISMFELCAEIRTAFGYKAKQTELEILHYYSKIPFLVIDEIGRSKSEQAEQNRLSHIIDQRHSNILQTVLISNKHQKKECPIDKQKGCDECLDFFIGSDVIDRLKEDAVLLRFSGESHRGKNK